jgi:6-phosphogluconolactonase
MTMKQNPTITICKDADALATQAAERIIQAAAQAIEERGRFMVALAGGSTPEKTYTLLAQPACLPRIDWGKTYLFFGDERFVPPDDPRSNYGMVRRTLLASVPVPADHLFPVPTDRDTADACASAYAGILRAVFGATDPRRPPRFDLILLGLGDDGHTASLFPHAASLAVEDRWVVASPPGTLPPPIDRITLTFPVLNAAREVIFLVSGEKKAAVLQELLEGLPSREQRPASGVHPDDGALIWLIDEAAAQRLTERG